MENTTNTETKTVHKFERAGLGKAPFRVVGSYESKYQACPGAPVQPGTSCDYCATSITQVFRVRGADGREFKVGSDCVFKTFQKGERVYSDVEKLVRKHQKTVRLAREERQIAEGFAFLVSADVIAFTTSTPSPTAWRAEQGETLADHYAFIWTVSGIAGKLRLIKTARAEVEATR